MSRTIITTCGTSLFQSSCWSYNDLNKKQLSTLDELDRREQEIICESNLKEARDRDNESVVSGSFDPSSWINSEYDSECLRDMPAELASLKAIQIYLNDKKFPLGADDKVKLLHSNNKDGKFCAEILSTVLNNKAFNLLPEVSIDTWQVNGLDPLEFPEFGIALQSIWRQIIENLIDNDTKYIFNLTGGYKGVSILLGAIAYYETQIPIFYLHEETNFKHISIMNFTKSEDIEKRFYIDMFDMDEGTCKSAPNGPDAF